MRQTTLFVEGTILVRVKRGCVAVEDVVGALGNVGGCERGLHLEAVPEDAQDRLHPFLFLLRLF